MKNSIISMCSELLLFMFVNMMVALEDYDDEYEEY